MICDKCGRENEERYKFCLGCGAPLSRMKAPAPSASEAGPLPVISSGAASVVSPVPTGVPVGRAIAAPAALAPEPAPVREAEPAPVSLPRPAAISIPAQPAAVERVCTGCGTLVPPDFIFCGRCGTRYDASGAQVADEETEPADELMSGDTQMIAPVRGRLVLINPDGTPGEPVGLLEGDNVLGRSSDIEVLQNDEFLSDEHVRLVCRGGKVVIEDLGSVNGVFLRLDATPVTLRHNDVVRVGQELLRYVDPPRAHLLIPGDGETIVMGSPPQEIWGALHRIVAPDVEAQIYELSGSEQRIGREVGDIVFRDDGFVSGQHALLVQAPGGGAQLQDLDSSNGTYIRIRGPYELTDGDFLLMGQQLFLVSLE